MLALKYYIKMSNQSVGNFIKPNTPINTKGMMMTIVFLSKPSQSWLYKNVKLSLKKIVNKNL